METSNQAVLTVLFYSALAAALAALGTLPFLGRERITLRGVGWAYALAAGLMLGAAYILMTEGLRLAVWPVVLGASAGVGLTYWMHAYTGTQELETSPGAEIGADYIVKFVLLNALHSASEGVAIGVAMATTLELGAFVAMALAVHNIAEAIVLTDVLRRRGLRLGQAAALSIITNVPMVLLAIVAFAIMPAVPGLLEWMLGLTAGTLVYLVMTELLPSAYERSERPGVALIVSVATGGIVLLRGVFV